MICYITRATVELDARIKKYVQACKATQTPYFVIGWDRLLDAKSQDENEYQLKVYSPFTKSKAVHHILWFFYIWVCLIRNFRRYKVIHATNMENALFVLPFKLLGKRIIFDVYDSQIIRIEQKIIPIMDALILPHEKRIEQIGLPREKVKKLFIVENAPAINYQLKELLPRKDKKIHLSYVGTFQKECRGLENLLELVIRDDRFLLDIAGSGAELNDIVEKYAKECDRINYHGKVPYTEALEIMHNSDFIIALYYTCEPSHIYASPNKYHESLFLGRPIVTSKNTLVGERVKNSNTGYVVEDTYEALKSVFEEYGSPQFISNYSIKSKKCLEIWNKEYNNYRKDWLEGAYVNMISELATK